MAFVKTNIKQPDIFLQRGLKEYNKKQYQVAIKDFDDVVRIDPQFADGYYWRGNAKRRLNLVKNAIVDYDQAIKLNPKYKKAILWRGFLYFELKKYKVL